MKRIVLVLLGVICLLLPLVASGCVADTPATATPGIVTQTAMDTALTTKADATVVTDQGKRIDAVNTRIDQLPANNSYTKQQIDDLFATLKNDQSWITVDTGSSSGSSDSGVTPGDEGEYGTLLSEKGDLELWLEKVGGSADSEIFTSGDGGNKANYTLVIVNNDTGSSHSYTLELSFSPNDEVVLDPTQVSATADNSLTFTSNGADFTTIIERDLDFKSNKQRITKGDVETFKVFVNIWQVHHTNYEVIDWTEDFTISDKGTD